LRALALLVLCVICLAGCGGFFRVHEYATSYCPDSDTAPTGILAICPERFGRAPIFGDSIAVAVGEVLEQQYGYETRDSDWVFAVLDSACSIDMDDVRQHFPFTHVRLGGDGARALTERGVSLVLVGSQLDEKYRVTAHDAESGRPALGARTELSWRTARYTRGCIREITESRRVGESAELIASSLHWILTHDCKARGSRRNRLDHDQPWTQLSPKDEIERRIWY